MRLEDIFDVSGLQEMIQADSEEEEDKKEDEEEEDLETGSEEKEAEDDDTEEEEEEDVEGCEEAEEDMTEEEKNAFYEYVFAADDDDDDEEEVVESDDEEEEEVDEVVESDDPDDDLEEDLEEEDVDADLNNTTGGHPVNIEPGKPIPTSYYGPGPDAGLNIASFFCPECAEHVDVGSVNPIIASNAFCPVCSTSLIFTADAPEERIADLYDQFDEGTLIAAGVCPQHGEILTDTIEAGAESYCPYCGQNLVVGTADVTPGITAAVLSDPSTFKDLTPSEVTMALSGVGTENPVWHVIIRNEPVAQIRYASFQEVYAGGEDQDRLDTFVSADYQKSLTDAICQMGLSEVLRTQKAEVYTAVVDDELKFEQYRAAAAIEAQRDYREKTASTVDRFSRCFQLTMDGMDRGAYDQTLGNPLVRAVAKKMAAVGIHDSVTHATAAIHEGMPSHVANMFGQSLKYMEMEDEALTHIASHFESVDFTPPAVQADAADSHTDSLQDHLVNTSMPFAATNSMSVPNVGQGNPLRSRYTDMIKGIHSRKFSNRR